MIEELILYVIRSICYNFCITKYGVLICSFHYRMGNLCCIYHVKAGTKMVKQSGESLSVLEPGCHCVCWPCCFPVGRVSTLIKHLTVRCVAQTRV